VSDKLNSVTQAFLGDAFYELSVRRRLTERPGTFTADKLHKDAVKYVKASAQAKVIRTLTKEGMLSEEELDIVKSARNRKPKNIPKNSDPLEYKLATAFEALIGWHYAAGRQSRAEELAEIAMYIIERNEIYR
jgi:ribonuclease-3 family protein